MVPIIARSLIRWVDGDLASDIAQFSWLNVVPQIVANICGHRRISSIRRITENQVFVHP